MFVYYLMSVYYLVAYIFKTIPGNQSLVNKLSYTVSGNPPVFLLSKKYFLVNKLSYTVSGNPPGFCLSKNGNGLLVIPKGQ